MIIKYVHGHKLYHVVILMIMIMMMVITNINNNNNKNNNNNNNDNDNDSNDNDDNRNILSSLLLLSSLSLQYSEYSTHDFAYYMELP